MGFHDDCLKIFSPDGQEFWANEDGTISLGNPLRRQAHCTLDQIEAQTIEAMETSQNETQTIDCRETESSGPKSCWNVHKRHER